MKKFILSTVGALALLGGAFGLGLEGRSAAQVLGGASDDFRIVPQNQTQMQLSFAPVVKQTAPAVVNVFSQRKVVTRRVSSIFDDPFFQDFFGGRSEIAPRERMEQSLGSGVIVRSHGVIVTNAHVVKDADELQVVLGDRREFEAKLIALDEQSDIAVLQIDTQGERLPVLKIAEGSAPEIGDLVLAIGNPFGVGQSVSSGIVSALGRTNVSASSSFIQTDAAVNPGNSGGALVDLNGQLIGVNTAIFSRSGGSNGIGFAIPAELVARAVDSAISEGRIVRPWLGAHTQEVSSDMAASLGLDRPRGAIVSEIYPSGPADNAGLSKGDVILSINGNEVNDDSGLGFKLATLRPGETARLQVWKNGRDNLMSVRVALPQEIPARDERAIGAGSPFSGMSVVNMSPALAEELDFDPYISGVVVSQISRRSAASQYFRTGDIILEVNGTVIDSTLTLDDTLRLTEERASWDISLDRNGRIQSGTVHYRQ